jgi:opacity protein-like surface antigen
MGGEAGVGIYFKNNFRFEGALAYTESSKYEWDVYKYPGDYPNYPRDIDTRMDCYAFKLNGFYDFHLTSRFDYYIGASLGFGSADFSIYESWNDYNNGYYHRPGGHDEDYYSKEGVLYGLSTGFTYNVTKRFAVNAGVAGSWLSGENELNMSGFDFGFRYSF